MELKDFWKKLSIRFIKHVCRIILATYT